MLSARTTCAAVRVRTVDVYRQDANTVSERFSVTTGVRGDAWHTDDGRSQKSASEPTLPFDDRRASASTGKMAAAGRIADRTRHPHGFIDRQSCECCWNTLSAGWGDSLLALYRDIPRDMALARPTDGGKTWTRTDTVDAFG